MLLFLNLRLTWLNLLRLIMLLWTGRLCILDGQMAKILIWHWLCLLFGLSLTIALNLWSGIRSHIKAVIIRVLLQSIFEQPHRGLWDHLLTLVLDCLLLCLQILVCHLNFLLLVKVLVDSTELVLCLKLFYSGSLDLLDSFISCAPVPSGSNRHQTWAFIALLSRPHGRWIGFEICCGCLDTAFRKIRWLYHILVLRKSMQARAPTCLCSQALTIWFFLLKIDFICDYLQILGDHFVSISPWCCSIRLTHFALCSYIRLRQMLQSS